MITEKDKKMLTSLEANAKAAAARLRGLGETQIANDLLLAAGFAIGLAHRLEDEFQKYQDAIDGAIGP